MESKDLGGAAFPHGDLKMPGFAIIPADGGMSLRDYFAAKAMVGMLGDEWDYDCIPDEAYKIADKMIKQRSK